MGNLVDSTGLVSSGVLQSLVFQNTGTINQSFPGTTLTDVTGSAANFAVTRTCQVLVMGGVQMGVTGGVNDFFVSVAMDGAGTVFSSAISGPGIVGFYLAPLLVLFTATPGAHTVKLWGLCDNAGTTGKVISATYSVLQLGA